MINKMIIRKHIGAKSIRRIASVLLVAVVVLLSQVLPVMSADEDLYTANWLKGTSVSLPLGASGSWDGKGVGVSCVINDGGTLKMWYTGYNSSDVMKIGYATYNIGTQTWDKYNSNGGPVFSGTGGVGAWDEKGVGSPCVIWDPDANLFKMWYTGYKEVSGEQIPQIGYATSTNGIGWTPGNLGNPVLTPGAGLAWDNKGVHSCWVIRESAASYKMWYTGRTGGSVIGDSAIGYTTSTDGIANWNANKSGSNPVFDVGASGSWDDRGVAVANVVNANSKYTMWYTGYSGFGPGFVTSAIGVAQSTDGITSWTRNAKPVVTKGASETWNAGSVGAPFVYEASGTQLVMLYSGFDTGLTPQIGTATVKTTQISGSAKLQGQRLTEGQYYNVPFVMKFYDPSVVVDATTLYTTPIVTPMFEFSGGDISFTGYNTSTITVSFSINVPSGTYQVALYAPGALVNLKQVTIETPAQAVNMGTMLFGNPNNDFKVTAADFALMLTDYLAEPGDGNWYDGRCDFNLDNIVQAKDFSLVVDNYNKLSPQSVS